MSTNKTRIRPLKTNTNVLIHEEIFDGKPAKVGCKCKENGDDHGGGWIQCTQQDCLVWHCFDNITDNYVLIDDEIDDLQDSNDIFKCILHGFNRMKIGNKSLFDNNSDNDDDNKNEEQYEPPSNTKIIKQKQKRKRKTETINTNNSVIPIAPPIKKRKIDLNCIPPLEPYPNPNPNQKHNNYIIDGKNIYQINKSELKQLCRKNGLKVTGTKCELIDSLLSPSKPAILKIRNNAMEKVHNILREAGIEDPEKVNPCLKKGIEQGYVTIDLNKNGLNEIICSGLCELCDKKFNATIKDCLYQKVYGGDDYEMGSQGGAIQHECEGLGCQSGMYVTEICEGKARFNGGKFHNHCTECPGFGKCIGDYRVAHCDKCDEHYFGEHCRCTRRGDDECLIQ